MFLIDPNAKSALIPAKFSGGRFINQITGLPLKEIAADSACEIILLSGNVLDPDLIAVLADKSEVQLLPKDSVLLAQINPTDTPHGLRQYLVRPAEVSPTIEGKFVEIKILRDLKMTFRGSKTPQLKGCPCSIRATNASAQSLNHAYSLVSLAFEPKRASHTGNVFQKILYKHNFNSAHEWWRELGDLRSEKLSEYGQYLSQRYNKLRNERQSRLFES